MFFTSVLLNTSDNQMSPQLLIKSFLYFLSAISKLEREAWLSMSSNAMLRVEGRLELSCGVRDWGGEGEGDRVGNYNDYPRSAITWMTKRRVIQ